MLRDLWQTDSGSRAGHARGVESGSEDSDRFFFLQGITAAVAAAHSLQPLVALLAVVEARAKAGDGDLVSCHQ